MKEKGSSPWSILGLEPGASLREVTSAYHRKAFQAHPDYGGTNAAFVQLQDAYKTILSNFKSEEVEKFLAEFSDPVSQANNFTINKEGEKEVFRSGNLIISQVSIRISRKPKQLK